MNETTCPICLDPMNESDDHAECRHMLFGTSQPVTIDIEMAKLHTLALATVGRTTLSGVQKKLSAKLDSDRKTLRLQIGRGNYIVKPPSDTYPGLPANEHVTMIIAGEAGIARPACGLVKMKDGAQAYVVRRFDRTSEGRKLHLEDYCQLMQLLPKDKYDSSAERCATVTRKFATEPTIQLRNLYKYVLFSWWCGNGDLHLKNLSLLRDSKGIVALSPAYDQLCTLLSLPGDQLALPVQGKRDNLKLKTWKSFASNIKLTEKAALRAIGEIVATFPRATELVDRSFLANEQKEEYKRILEDRTATLMKDVG